MTSSVEQPAVPAVQIADEEILAMKKAVEEYEERVQSTQSELCEVNQFVVTLEQKLSEVEETNHNLELQNAEIRKEFDLSSQKMKNQLEAKIEELIINHEQEGEEWKKKNMNAITEWTKAAEGSSLMAEELAVARTTLEANAKRIRELEELNESKTGEDGWRAFEEEQSKSYILQVTVDNLEEELSKAKSEAKKSENKLAAFERAKANSEKIDWEEKFTQEEARCRKLEADLVEIKRALREEKASIGKFQKDAQKYRHELEKLESLKEKEESKLRSEIAGLWDTTQKHAELLDSSIEDERTKARANDMQRIKELEEKLAESEREQNVMRARLGLAERDLITTKKKARKQTQNQAVLTSTEKIFVRPEASHSQSSAVDAMQKKLSGIKTQHVFLTMGFFLVVIQLFFPSLLTYKK